MAQNDAERVKAFGDAVASLPTVYQIAVAAYINGLKAGSTPVDE